MSAEANWDPKQYNDPVEIIKILKQKCTKFKDKTVKKFKQKQARNSTAKTNSDKHNNPVEIKMVNHGGYIVDFKFQNINLTVHDIKHKLYNGPLNI